MKETDDTLLGRHLSGDPPEQAFREQTLRDSTAAFIRVRRLRCAWRRARFAAAAVLVAGAAFLGGRLSVPNRPAGHAGQQPRPVVESGRVTVPAELLAWLEAARLFRQLGMEDRMARSVERAGRLLPAGTFIADGRTEQAFAAARPIENREEAVELTGTPEAHASAQNVDQILAQVFGD